MKMAKASQDDLDKMRLFYQVMEAYYQAACENHHDFTDLFKDSEMEQISSAFNDKGEFDIDAFLRLSYDHLLSGFFRVHFGYQVLLSNACDPSEDSLQFKDWIKQSIEVLSEIDEYISPNPTNYIGFDSTLHQKVKSVLSLHEKSLL